MERANRRSILGQHISEILSPSDTSAHTRGNLRATASKGLICGGMALLVIAPVEVEAVGLGELTVQSTIGRPLQAVVPMRIGKGESLAPNCVQPGKSRGDLGVPPNLRVHSPVISGTGTYNLRISTPGSLHEPMYELSLVVNCPGTPILVRHYVFMLDLPGAAPIVQTVDVLEQPANRVWPDQQPAPTVQAAAPVRNAARPDSARLLEKSAAPVDAGTLYRVRSGDTLSTIAKRVDGRLPNATWALAERLFATNPDAFIDNNPDLIKLGSLIRIPDAAALASIAPATSRGFTQASAPATHDPDPAPVPRPAVDTPSPAVTRVETNNTEVGLAELQESSVVLETEVAPVGITADVYEEIAAEETSADSESNREVWEFDEGATAESDGTTDTALENPFADDITAGSAATADVQPEVAPATNPAVESGADSETNPWLAIGAGLLLGLAIGALALRRRFLTVLANLMPSRDLLEAVRARFVKSSPAAKSGSGRPEQPDGFNTRVASSAFDTSVDRGDDVEPLPIGDPMEKTYIVESMEQEPTQEIGDSTLENADVAATEINADVAATEINADVAATEIIDEPDIGTELTAAEKSDEDLLAEIFEEGPADSSGTGALEPTSKLPQTPEEEIFDPSGELPQQFVEDVFDPTAEMPIDPLEADQGNLMQAFTEELEQIDPGTFNGPAQIDAAAETIQSEKITSPAAEETSLDALPDSSEEDDEMSKTLYDALTLLESDYEDEFTASQILERSAIKKSLANLEAEEDDDESIDEELAG